MRDIRGLKNPFEVHPAPLARQSAFQNPAKPFGEIPAHHHFLTSTRVCSGFKTPEDGPAGTGQDAVCLILDAGKVEGPPPAGLAEEGLD